jgi:hypothetical protein
MKNFFLLILLAASLAVTAQDDATPKYRQPKLILKWSPIHLLAHFPTLQVALEHRLSQKIAVQYDFGPVINFNGLAIRTDNDKHGFKAKFQVRRYWPAASRHWKFFTAPEVYYNKVNFKMGETYLVHDESGLDYYQYIQYDRRYREGGFSLNGGAVFSTYRFSIDFQVGLAQRFVRYNSLERPNSTKYQLIPEKDHFPLNPIRQSQNLLSPTACIRFCFILH